MQAETARREHNPAELKLGLGLFGVNVEASSSDRSRAVEIMLPDESCVRARIDAGSPYSLAGDEDAIVHDGDGEYPVRVSPEPDFAQRKNARGVELGAIVQVRGLYAVVALDGGCGLSNVGRTCALCLGRELTQRGGEWWPVEEVVEALRAVFDEGAAEFVHFNVGYMPGDDAGVARLRPYIEAVRRYFDARIGVTMHPPAMLRAIDVSYAMGFDVVCYNFEAATELSLERHFPGRTRFLGRQRYLAALGHAAKVFPSGAVWSHVVAGLDSPDDTRGAIAEIATTGAVPFLAFPDAAPLGTPLMLRTLPNCPGFEVAGRALFDETLKAGTNMSWARGLSTALSPLEARHFVSDAPQLPVILNQIGRNRFGALATRSLARLRRRLRVRKVRDSFDSSHL